MSSSWIAGKRLSTNGLTKVYHSQRCTPPKRTSGVQLVEKLPNTNQKEDVGNFAEKHGAYPSA